MPETAEQLSQQPEVRKELERASGKKPAEKVKAPVRDKFWFVTHALLLIGCVTLFYLIGSKFIPLAQAQVDFSHRLLRGAALIIIVLALVKVIRVYAIGRIEDAATRFTLRRILLLLSGLFIAVVAISGILGVPAAYALARREFPGKKFVTLLLLFGLPQLTDCSGLFAAQVCSSRLERSPSANQQ